MPPLPSSWHAEHGQSLRTHHSLGGVLLSRNGGYRERIDHDRGLTQRRLSWKRLHQTRSGFKTRRR
jgi:hypothetical protein